MLESMMAACASVDGLVISRAPRPHPAPDQILVKVRAAGVNRADLVAAKGSYMPSPQAQSAPIGMEWAGEVVEAGSNVSEFAIGDMVACSGAGGYAEYAVADKGRAIRFDPELLAIEKAAVLSLALMTAHNALITEAMMRPGDAVLVNGASSAVGLATLQIARLLGAGLVAGSSTDAAKRDRLREFGADYTLDPRQEGWATSFLEATKGNGANVVIDMITGAGLNEVMRASAVLARIVNVGRLGGKSAPLDFDLHALKRINFIGVTFRTRTLAEVREIVTAMKADLWDFVERGTLSLPVDRSFPLVKAAEAHAYMAANRHFGKLVLIP